MAMKFEESRKSLSVAVNGPLMVDDVEIVIRAAVDGIGLAFVRIAASSQGGLAILPIHSLSAGLLGG
jgi:hypothetical protein